MSDFVWSDAWLLLSLIDGGEPIDRQRIREIGDFINHAVFTDARIAVAAWNGPQARGHVRQGGRNRPPQPLSCSGTAATTKGKSRTYVFKDLAGQRISRLTDATIKRGRRNHPAAPQVSNVPNPQLSGRYVLDAINRRRGIRHNRRAVNGRAINVARAVGDDGHNGPWGERVVARHRRGIPGDARRAGRRSVVVAAARIAAAARTVNSPP